MLRIVQRVEERFDTKLADLKFEPLKWLIGLAVAQAGLLVGFLKSVFSKEEANLQKEVAAYIRSVVEALPPIYREALLLTGYDGISQVQLAGQLGLSLSIAKSRVQRARAMVKEEIGHCCHWTTDRYGTVVNVQRKNSTTLG